MSLIDKLKLVWSWRRLGKAVAKEQKMDEKFDPRITAWKAIRELGINLGAIALTAVVAALADPEFLDRVLSGIVPPAVLAPAVAVIVAVAAAVRNWLNNRDKGKLAGLLLALGLLAGPAAAEVTERTSRTICHDGWVYTETCGVVDDDKVCTLAPLARLEAGAAVKGCSAMTYWGTAGMLAAAHGADLATTDWAGQHGATEGNPLVGNRDDGSPNVGRLMAMKLVVVFSATTSIHALAKHNPRAARKARGVTIALLALISGNNIYQALQARAKAAAPAGAFVPTDRPAFAVAHTVTW